MEERWPYFRHLGQTFRVGVAVTTHADMPELDPAQPVHEPGLRQRRASLGGRRSRHRKGRILEGLGRCGWLRLSPPSVDKLTKPPGNSIPPRPRSPRLRRRGRRARPPSAVTYETYQARQGIRRGRCSSAERHPGWDFDPARRRQGATARCCWTSSDASCRTRTRALCVEQRVCVV